MVEYEQEFLEFIAARGVGDNDSVEVGATQRSYLSYLRGASERLGVDVTAETLGTEAKWSAIENLLDSAIASGSVARGTGKNYKSALRHYHAMIQERPDLR
jgi:hypothetical protein